jgi:protein-tyrosine phosphatase
MNSHRNVVAQLAFSFILALSLAAPAGARTPKKAAPPTTAGTTHAMAIPANIRIDNFGRVSGSYFRGAQPKGQDFSDLAGLGVKLVIDLAQEGDINERANVEREGMKFVRIPMTTNVQPSQAVVDQFLALVNDPANQPVYVHCMGGRHRTGVMTAAYRMTQEGWTADKAFSEMKQYKFGADFLHPEFKSFVYSFYSGLDRSHAPNVLVASSTPAVR